MNDSKKRVWAAVVASAVGSILVWSFSLAGSGSSGKPRPSTFDLLNTKIRNAAFDLVFDLLPKPMVDPVIDEGDIFSYFARPSFQLGIRGEHFATQVMDGHLWTGAAEWLVLLGDTPEPLNQRIWTLHKGYLPCINYSVHRDGVDYTVRAFQFYLKDRPDEMPVNFIRVIAENNGERAAKANFAGGFMYGPRDHRCPWMRQMGFRPWWSYEMTERAAFRDDKLIYAWSRRPTELQARPGKPYTKGFTGAGRTDPVCLATYKRELGPGESFAAEFAMPHYPSGPDLAGELSGADFDERLSAFEEYWEGWLDQGARFEVSEGKVVDATRSYVVHALMSQNVISDSEVEQHVNRLQYNRFWLRDSAFFVSMYEKWGYPEVAEKLCRHFFKYQRDNGNFMSQRGQLDGWGQAMYAFGTHVRYTGDEEFAKEALPYVERAVAWLEKALADDAWGLMPPTDAADNESIMGRYTGHNFWSLTGLDAAIDLCELAGREDLVERYGLLRKDYYDRFMVRLREVALDRGGIIPPGLDVPGGTSWGNLLAVYPGHIMDPFDPLVTGTFDYIRSERMAEGIAMWHKTMHHYITERVAQTAMIRGEQELVLDDFYSMLLHTGSCHEGFEFGPFPWNGRDYCMGTNKLCNFPPHGWYAANMNILFRNMLIRADNDTLHLCSVLSPEWTRPGDRVVVEGAPTRFDEVSFTLEVTESGAVLDFSFQGCACSLPAQAVFHVPYYVKVTAAHIDGKEIDFSGSEIELPLEGGKLSMDWERLPTEPRNYETIVEWYKGEYRRRWDERR